MVASAALDLADLRARPDSGDETNDAQQQTDCNPGRSGYKKADQGRSEGKSKRGYKPERMSLEILPHS